MWSLGNLGGRGGEQVPPPRMVPKLTQGNFNSLWLSFWSIQEQALKIEILFEHGQVIWRVFSLVFHFESKSVLSVV